MARKAPGHDVEFEFAEDPADQTGPRPADWVLMLLRAARRRRVLFVSVFVIGCCAVFSYYRLKKPVYRVEAKILAQRGALPSNMRSGADDNPARTAWELIHRRDNLLALIKTAKLMDTSSLGGLAAIRSRAGLSRDTSDPLDRMVTTLDKRLLVSAEEGGTINISLDWPDPQQAYGVVEGALQNFIEARHIQEVTAIDEVLSVLHVRAAKAKEELGRVSDEVRQESIEGYRENRDSSPSAPRSPPAARVPSEELIRLKSLLDGKQRAIEDVEEYRRRRLADLHAKLDEARNTFSDAHPVVIQLRQDIDALSKESTQVSGLRDEEAKLRRDYQIKVAQEGMSGGSTGQQPAPAPLPSRPALRSRASNTPVEDDERVRDARFEYQQIVERVNAAQLELDAVRAAFKYRYNVIWPPQLPRDPVSPNPVKVFGAGLVAALFLAFLAAALPDLRSGRIVERWQVERSLGLTVLAEISKK